MFASVIYTSYTLLGISRDKLLIKNLPVWPKLRPSHAKQTYKDLVALTIPERETPETALSAGPELLAAAAAAAAAATDIIGCIKQKYKIFLRYGNCMSGYQEH